MTRICPKCHYARKPTDDAPEWQCPSCQVAYNKAAEVRDAAAYGREVVLPVRAPSKGSSGIWWGVLAALLYGGVVLTMPSDKPANRSAGIVVGEAVAGQPVVTLYSTTWCGYCTATRKFLVDNNIQFVELDIEKSKDGYEGHKKNGGRGVPLITVGDDVVHGYNAQRLQQLLQPWMTRS